MKKLTKLTKILFLYSQTGFSRASGGRPGAAKVLVVVTDGESHDNDMRDGVIAACEKQGITRFGIAVSEDLVVF